MKVSEYSRLFRGSSYRAIAMHVVVVPAPSVVCQELDKQWTLEDVSLRSQCELLCGFSRLGET